MSIKDYQLYFFDGQPLANGTSRVIEPSKTSDIGKAYPPMFLSVAMSGQTGAATADVGITLATGDLLDGSDAAPNVTWYVPKARVSAGGLVLVAPLPPFLKHYHKLTVAGLDGVTGGTIAAAYAADGDRTNLL